MQDQQLKLIFKYLDEFKSQVNLRFDNVEFSINQLQTGLDGLTKRFKDFNDEHVILHNRVNLLESWTKKVAPKINTPFNQ